jgi:hypothetical protein
MLGLLAFLWLGVLTFACLAAYWFGWWYRGRWESERRAERHERYKQERAWRRHLEQEQRRRDGPQLRAVE